MPTQLTTGDLVTAANWNSIPAGVLAYVQVTAAQTGVTTETNLTGLNSGAITMPASRRVRVTVVGNFSGNAANSRVRIRIREGATTIHAEGYITNPSTSFDATLHMAVVLAPSAGSHTYHATLQPINGGSEARLIAGTASPAYLLVEDLGAA